jgi:hypothetical protein
MKNVFRMTLLMLLLLLLAVLALVKIFVSEKPQSGLPDYIKGVKARPKAVKAAKTIKSGFGLITVELQGSGRKKTTVGVRLFKLNDPRTSIYYGTMLSGRPHEVVPGRYDILVDVTPPRIYKDAEVAAGKEKTIDLGCITGALKVKVRDSDGKELFSPVAVLKPGTADIVTTAMASRPAEIGPGVYDVELLSGAREKEKGVNVRPGEETVVEFTVPKPAAAPLPAATQKK